MRLNDSEKEELGAKLEKALTLFKGGEPDLEHVFDSYVQRRWCDAEAEVLSVSDTVLNFLQAGLRGKVLVGDCLEMATCRRTVDARKETVVADLSSTVSTQLLELDTGMAQQVERYPESEFFVGPMHGYLKREAFMIEVFLWTHFLRVDAGKDTRSSDG